MLSIGTLFSGVGTGEIAFENVFDKLDVKFACEIDKYSRMTFIENVKINPKNFHHDILEFSPPR